MSKRIVLVGPQSSAEDAGAARAAAIAQRAGIPVEFLDVVYDPHLAGFLGDTRMFESLRTRLMAEHKAKAEALAESFEKRGIACAEKVIWADSRHTVVAREAAAEGVELVVLEPEDPLRGLTQDEWQLIAACPAPVLVVRADADASYATIVAGVDPGQAHHKPAGLDAQIVEQAKAIGDLFGARVNVLHCAPPIPAFIRDPSVETEVLDLESTIRSELAASLDALAKEAGLPEDAVSVVAGRPDDVLAERSAEDGTLIVIGTVARGPIERMLIGSAAARVLREIGGDVLVVKPPGFAPRGASG